MKKALILGCSHAVGAEMADEPEVDLLDYHKDYYGYFMSYPAQLARLLGYQPVNHAISGGSNDAMFRIFESFVNPYKDFEKPDIVIACWTGGNRTEIWDDEEQWLALCGGKPYFYKVIPDKLIPQGKPIGEPIKNYSDVLTYQKQWITHHADRQWGRINKLKNILALNTMAANNKIPVINIDSFDCVQEYTFPDSVYRPVGQTEFSNWALALGFAHTHYSRHYFLSAHTSFANLVYKKIDPKYHADFTQELT